MYLKLDNIPTVINACFVLQNLCEYHNMHIDEDLVKIQIKAAKKKNNNNGIENAADPVYSYNVSAVEVQ